MEYSTIDSTTGEIVHSGVCQDDDFLLQVFDPLTQFVIEGSYSSAEYYYVDDPSWPTARPVLTGIADYQEIVADGTDQTIATGLPNPTVVQVDTVNLYTVTDGSFEIATSIPGTYQVRIVPPFPTQDFEVVVVAT